MAAFSGDGHAPCEDGDMLEFSPPPSIWVELKVGPVSSPSLVPSPARHLPPAQQPAPGSASMPFHGLAASREREKCAAPLPSSLKRPWRSLGRWLGGGSSEST